MGHSHVIAYFRTKAQQVIWLAGLLNLWTSIYQMHEKIVGKTFPIFLRYPVMDFF